MQAYTPPCDLGSVYYMDMVEKRKKVYKVLSFNYRKKCRVRRVI